MRLLIAFLICISFVGVQSFAQKGTFVDSVQFIQYLDESTALEEVKKGNLDIYYFRIPAELLQDQESTKNLNVFYTTGGSYSILVNPAVGEKFNPFSIQKVRFALNYLVDRNLIVDELMGGSGVAMISNYGPFDPDYLLVVNEIEQFHFTYDPELAQKMITEALSSAGATKINEKWYYNQKPVQVTIFIRNDDPVRKSIGELISSELEKIGFTVKKDFGDLNKAFVVVYGSNPADMKWSMYTEGFAGRSAFVRYDQVGLAQMYAPWFSNMPGFNNPSYWNYKNTEIDELTQKIYSSNYTSKEQRTELIRRATISGVNESVRIFLAAKIDPFVANNKVSGIINDLGGGITTRLTPINAKTDHPNLKIGVKQIYQGAWNPVRGFGDAYSKNIWDLLYDPGMFKNPYSGYNFPVRHSWTVQTEGPNGTVDVPDDAIKWDTKLQKWVPVQHGTKATSKVTYHLLWSSWHHGQKMDMDDILYSIYFGQEWATSGDDDKTFDPEYSPAAAQFVKTFVGVKILDENTVETYVNYWHFDESEIADWAGVWITQPWEIMAAMEQAVIDGKTSFSRTDSQSKNLSWLSLIIPRDAQLIKSYLEEFKKSKKIPPSIADSKKPWAHYQSRYQAAINWIEQKNHAVISNGPFYLQSYSPEARTITIKSFDDPSYPFEAGHWGEFENVQFPKITKINLPDSIIRGKAAEIQIQTSGASSLHFFLNSADGTNVYSDILDVKDGTATLTIPAETTSKMDVGGSDVKLYAVSDSVLRPDIYTTSLFVASYQDNNTTKTSISYNNGSNKIDNYGILFIVLGAIIIIIITYFRRKKMAKSAATV